MKIFFTLAVFSLGCLIAKSQSGCDTWLRTQDRFAAIRVGDLDVTGNQITVEANFVMTGGSADIVSKHKGGNDLNYLLRPSRAEISTEESGFVTTNFGNGPCNDSLELNKTYHAALVYNGITLKFYRNGALISTVAAHGNLLTNNWETAIGEHAPVVTPYVNGDNNPEYHNQNASQGWLYEAFNGYINEVRIWNVARTQEQIRAYMNSSLPDPQTQTGLLGYWVMNDLHNLQGNSAYDGFIEGTATINQTNPNCAFIADSCGVLLPVKLTSFNAHAFQNKAIQIDWHTESETGIRAYTIQRSLSAGFNAVTEIGTVSSAAGSTANNYSFTDESLSRSRTYYYRLKINEFDGKVSYSAVRTGRLSGEAVSVNLYPNPTHDGIVNVTFNDISGNATIAVFNNAGQKLLGKTVSAFSGSVVQLDLKKFGKGNYFINVITADNKVVRKLVQL